MRTDNTPECVCPNDFSGPFCEGKLDYMTDYFETVDD